VLGSGAAEAARIIERIKDGTVSLSLVSNNKNWTSYQVCGGSWFFLKEHKFTLACMAAQPQVRMRQPTQRRRVINGDH
jgi:hypothetical protein